MIRKVLGDFCRVVNAGSNAAVAFFNATEELGKTAEDAARNYHEQTKFTGEHETAALKVEVANETKTRIAKSNAELRKTLASIGIDPTEADAMYTTLLNKDK